MGATVTMEATETMGLRVMGELGAMDDEGN